jgi:hypothetical protein
MLTQKNVLLLHSNIFINLGVSTETISQKYKFIIQFKQILADKNLIFKLDCNPKANFNVVVLKFKQKKCFVFTFKISKFLTFKSATDLISMENFLSAEIKQVTNFRSLKLNWSLKLPL